MSKNLNLEIAKKFLEDNYTRFNQVDVNYLIQCECPSVVIEMAIYADAKYNNTKCLYSAVEYGLRNICKIILDREKIDINALREGDRTIVEWAVKCAIQRIDYSKWYEVIELLLEKGANVTIEALRLAKDKEVWDILKILLNYYKE